MMPRRLTRQAGTIGLAMLLGMGCAGKLAPAGADSGNGALSRLEMSLREPEVAKVGRNRFQVVVADGFGQPLRGAEVSLTLYRRGIPGSKGYIEHPVQTKVALTPGEQPGVYEAVGPIVAAGAWDVKMQVKPSGGRGRQITSTTKIWADH
jgi:hypothetical protein